LAQKRGFGDVAGVAGTLLARCWHKCFAFLALLTLLSISPNYFPMIFPFHFLPIYFTENSQQ
jgi:hypothetical protein